MTAKNSVQAYTYAVVNGYGIVINNEDGEVLRYNFLKKPCAYKSDEYNQTVNVVDNIIRQF